MSKEAILEQIIGKAQLESESIKRSALDATAEQKAKFEDELKAEYEKKIALASEEAEVAIAGQKTLLRLDGNKSELKVKRELIDEVYGKAKEKIVKLGDNDYRKLIAGLISKYAENGDKVIICKEDEKRLSANWLSDLAYDLQLELSFDTERHCDVGGVVLRGSKYDKNLTVSALISEARSHTEGEIAKRLFR